MTALTVKSPETGSLAVGVMVTVIGEAAARVTGVAAGLPWSMAFALTLKTTSLLPIASSTTT